jgi:hypothetical protein
VRTCSDLTEGGQEHTLAALRARPRVKDVEVELGALECFTGQVRTNGYVVQASIHLAQCAALPNGGEEVPLNRLPGRLRHGRRELLSLDDALQAGLLDVAPPPTLEQAQPA